MEKLNPCTLLMGYKMEQMLWKTFWQLLTVEGGVTM
jgi:hypothetical protein